MCDFQLANEELCSKPVQEQRERKKRDAGDNFSVSGLTPQNYPNLYGKEALVRKSHNNSIAGIDLWHICHRQ